MPPPLLRPERFPRKAHGKTKTKTKRAALNDHESPLIRYTKHVRSSHRSMTQLAPLSIRDTDQIRGDSTDSGDETENSSTSSHHDIFTDAPCDVEDMVGQGVAATPTTSVNSSIGSNSEIPDRLEGNQAGITKSSPETYQWAWTALSSMMPDHVMAAFRAFYKLLACRLRLGFFPSGFVLLAAIWLVKILIKAIINAIVTEYHSDSSSVRSAIGAMFAQALLTLQEAAWWVSEEVVVPLIRASNNSSAVQRWIEVFSECSSSMAPRCNNASLSAAASLVAASTSGLLAGATATATALTATATAASTVNAMSADNVSSTTSTLVEVGDTKVFMFWAQMDQVQQCADLMHSVLEQHKSSLSAGAVPPTWSPTSSLLEQLGKLHPAVKHAAESHPECFKWPVSMIATGGQPAHPFDSHLAHIFPPTPPRSEQEAPFKSSETKSQRK